MAPPAWSEEVWIWVKEGEFLEKQVHFIVFKGFAIKLFKALGKALQETALPLFAFDLVS